MKIISPKYEIITDIDQKKIYSQIETAGRTCYKSEIHITEDSSRKFVAGIVKSGHEAMLEHASISVRFTVDRGVSHEIVRHRLASFAQESTRYCNYSKSRYNREITVIKPLFFIEGTEAYETWKHSCEQSEKAYFRLLEIGALPEEARSVLPSSLKTEIIMTANMREWRHFLSLRAAGTTGTPHPQIKEVARPLLYEFASKLPEIFEDIAERTK